MNQMSINMDKIQYTRLLIEAVINDESCRCYDKSYLNNYRQRYKKSCIWISNRNTIYIYIH